MLKNVDRYLAIERSIRTSELAGIAKSILALVSELNDRLSDEAYGSLFEESGQKPLDRVREAVDTLVGDACAVKSGLTVLSNIVTYGFAKNDESGDYRHEKKDCH